MRPPQILFQKMLGTASQSLAGMLTCLSLASLTDAEVLHRYSFEGSGKKQLTALVAPMEVFLVVPASRNLATLTWMVMMTTWSFRLVSFLSLAMHPSRYGRPGTVHPPPTGNGSLTLEETPDSTSTYRHGSA